MKTYRDQVGRSFSLSVIPSRVVSLVPSQTELLVDLGLGEKLIGVTKFCVHPEYLRKEKPVVGGTKKVKLEKIQQLKPDLILCNKEENTEEMVLELEKIAPVHVSDIHNLDDALEMICQYGEIFIVEEKARTLTEEISQKLDDFQQFMKDRPQKKVAYFIWKKPFMVAGGDTFIDYLLELNNFENVFRDLDSRYPEVNVEDVQNRGVDLILLSTEPYPFKEKHEKEFHQLFGGREVAVVDGEYFSWYGSRLLAAFQYFKSLHSYPCSS